MFIMLYALALCIHLAYNKSFYDVCTTAVRGTKIRGGCSSSRYTALSRESTMTPHQADTKDTKMNRSIIPNDRYNN